MNVLRKYWQRLCVTELDTERAGRSFWLQFAASRYPKTENAEDLISIADKFFGWHWDGKAIPREAQVSELRRVQ